MKLLGAIAGAALGAAAVLVAIPSATAQTDAQIRQRIIKQSIAAYPGNCPCPYNTDRAGRRCGARSAYNRPGGYAPKCFPADVTAAEVRAYRAGR